MRHNKQLAYELLPHISIYVYIFLFWLTEAKCDAASLSNTIDGINVSINQTESDINVIIEAKKNVRIAIDCRANIENRNEMFEHYNGLCKRAVVIRNVLSDLKIKVDILEKEKQRCQDRSKSFLTINLVFCPLYFLLVLYNKPCDGAVTYNRRTIILEVAS